MRRVLVVSRNPAMAMGLSSADYDVIDLRPARFRTWVAEGTSDVDVLVLDLDDPSAARAAMKELRENAAHTPVLIVSSAREGWDAPDLSGMRGARVLALPISRPSLLAALDSLLLPVEESDEESVFGPEFDTGEESLSRTPAQPLERDRLDRVLSEIDAAAEHALPDEEVPIIGPAPKLRLVAPAAPSPPGVVDGDLDAPAEADVLDADAAVDDAALDVAEFEDLEAQQAEFGAPAVDEAEFRDLAEESPVDLEYQPEWQELPRDAAPEVSPGVVEAEPVDRERAAPEDAEPTALGMALLTRNRSRWLASPTSRTRLTRQPATRIGPPEPTQVPAPPAVSPVDLVRQIRARIDELYSVAETAEVAIDAAVEQAEAEAGALLVPDGPHWKVVAGFGLRPLEYRYELSPASWLVQEIAQGGRALIIEDTDIARQSLQGAPLAAWRNLLVAPVRLVDGILLLGRERDPAFTERELARLAALIEEAAPLLAAAVEVRSLARDLGRLTAEDNTP